MTKLSAHFLALLLLWAPIQFPGAMAAAPTGWFLTGDAAKNYTCGIDSSQSFEGKPSLSIQSTASPTNGFATVMQNIAADKYLVKRVRLSGHLKPENVSGWCGLWMRIDGSKGAVLEMDNMSNRGLKGTKDWSECSVVLDVPPEAKKIAFGIIISDTGKVWASDLKLEPVGQDIATTSNINKAPMEPVNLDFKTP